MLLSCLLCNSSAKRLCEKFISGKQMAQTLIISSQPVVQGSIFAQLLERGIASLDSISFVTNSSQLPAGALPSDAFAVAFSFNEDAGSHDGQLLAELYRSMKASATLTIVEKDHEVICCFDALFYSSDMCLWSTDSA